MKKLVLAIAVLLIAYGWTQVKLGEFNRRDGGVHAYQVGTYCIAVGSLVLVFQLVIFRNSLSRFISSLRGEEQNPRSVPSHKFKAADLTQIPGWDDLPDETRAAFEHLNGHYGHVVELLAHAVGPKIEALPKPKQK